MSARQRAASAQDWLAANQKYLVAELARVRSCFTATDATTDTASRGRTKTAWKLAVPPAIDRVTSIFGLSAFERSVLLACAGVELDGGFSELWRRGPTFSQLLGALPDAHWSALSAAAPLRYWRMIEPDAGEPLVLSALRIDERMLHELAGVPTLDARLYGMVTPLAANPPRASSLQTLARQTADALLGAAEQRAPRVVQLATQDVATARAVAALACQLVSSNGWILAAADLSAAPAEREQVARLWDREALLGTGVLIIETDDRADAPRIAERFMGSLRAPVLVVSADALRLAGGQAVARIAVTQLPRQERQQLWRDALAERAAALDGDVERIAEQFLLGEPAIDALATVIRTSIDTDSPDDDVRTRVWDACREQLRARVDGLAQLVEPRASWHDIVLPVEQRAQLEEIVLHVRERATVYGRWGMDRINSRGLGVTALFAGPSGTGKTLAAEVLASELVLDLYRVDLSQVVSKYIGETEKNLSRLFDAAEASGAVLFFDEADALFGKRSEVKDSHDRYANIEVSYLLQRMENYRGLAILATNQKSALDSAFMRRLRFVVEFPFPGPTERREIWRRAFTDATPVTNLDLDALATLDLAGGSIRVVALGAAFHAAGARQPVGIEHVTRAARREFVKLGKPFTGMEPRR